MPNRNIENLVQDLNYSFIEDHVSRLFKIFHMVQQNASTPFDHRRYENIRISNLLLTCIFDIEIAGLQFTRDESELAGPLLKDCLTCLDDWTSSSQMTYSGVASDFSPMRSGLQFLLDNYKDFPDGWGGTLGSHLEEFESGSDLIEWDEEFRELEPQATKCEYFDSIRDKIPDSHWWWCKTE